MKLEQKNSLDWMSGPKAKNAAQIKKELVDFFQHSKPDFEVIEEVMYGLNRRMADQVFFNSNITIAIEIKSDLDSLTKIESQLNDYILVFDYVYIAIAKKHLENFFKSYDKNFSIGILLIDTKIKLLRRAKKQKEKKKQSMLFTVNSHILRSLLPNKKLNADELRGKICKRSMKTAQKLLITQLKEKLTERLRSNKF
jgi:hypothetical protein